MKWFYDLKVRNKLFLSFAGAVLIVLVIAFVSYAELKSSNQSLENMYKEHYLASLQAAELKSDINGVRAYLLNMTIQNEKTQKDVYHKKIQQLTLQIDNSFEQWFKHEGESNKYQEQYKEMDSIFTKLQKTWTDFRNTRDSKIIPLIYAGKNKEATAIASGIQAKRFQEMVTTADMLINKEKSEARAEITQSESDYFRTLVLYILLTLGAVTSGIVMAMFISRIVAGRLKKVAQKMNQISRGDFTVEKMDVDSKDEIGELIGDTNKLIDDLKPAIGGVIQSSVRVAKFADKVGKLAGSIEETSKQVSSAIAQISQGVSEQGKNTTEVSTTATEISQAIDSVAKGSQDQSEQVVNITKQIENLTQTIEGVVDNVGTTVKISDESAEAAETGSSAIEKALTGFENVRLLVTKNAEEIEALGERSKEISNIVEIIDDLADQTNLLALNAAIEAARAGEHGKGFAVVADEVRKLAERSTKATKEIGELISQVQSATDRAVESMKKGVDEIEEGSSLAGDAGTKLKQLVSSVKQVTLQVSQVAELSQQMKDISKRASDSVLNIAAITEESAAAVEEVAGSASNVADNITSIAAITEESAAASEEVAAQTEEQTAIITELNNAAQELTKVADDLKFKVEKFKIDEVLKNIEKLKPYEDKDGGNEEFDLSKTMSTKVQNPYLKVMN